MIGNDIVDLRQARRESNWQRPRYLKKLFTEQEQAWIAQASDPETLVWLFWSSKEAAYKKWAAEYQQRVFNPRKIEVNNLELIGSQTYRSQLTIGENAYQVQSIVAEEYIHSWTIIGEERLSHQAVFMIEGQQASEEVRHQLIQVLAERQQWEKSAIDIRSDALGRPIVYHENQHCGLSVSLSHHGGHGAYAFCGWKTGLF